jgi:FtsP/CotA-like multicopper oxidase with cupredoxin domain
MRAFANKKILALLALVAAAVGFAAVKASLAPAAPIPISLCASTGSITMPDGVLVNVWGFVETAACAAGLVNDTNFPGPVIDVGINDVVTITLANSLPGTHTASFELAGLPVKQTGAGTYEFTASRPGTFVYQSPGDAGRQTAMGLYGALIVRPATAGQAYAGAATAYDGEKALVLSAIDPVFNADPDTFDMNGYLATYWLINGKAYPDTTSIAAPTTGTRRLLLRYVNAGFDNTSMSLLGVHERVIARDAYVLSNPFDAAAETIPAGGTEDAIVTVPSGGATSANGFALFNRNLHVTNGTAAGNPNHQPGGMLTFITP